jgi:hypothetical protein
VTSKGAFITSEKSLFCDITKARAKLDGWTDKQHNSEMDMRNGAFRNFDIDEAIKTSDRRKAEKAAKKVLPDEEELGA